MSDDGDYDIDELRRRVEEDAGCPEFPALAEAVRRAGHAEEARRICQAGLSLVPGRLAGRVSLGLALMELGQEEAAKRELAAILDSALEPHRRAELAPEPFAPAAEPIAVPLDEAADFDAAVGDAELETAFASAEPQVDEMFSANKMAEQVLMEHAVLDGEEAEDLELDHQPTYGTETMAALLERQGDHRGAEAIRRSLEDEYSTSRPHPTASGAGGVDAAEIPAEAAPVASELDVSARARILSTLETWLHNIQRGRA